jgi:hypothetical protein
MNVSKGSGEIPAYLKFSGPGDLNQLVEQEVLSGTASDPSSRARRIQASFRRHDMASYRGELCSAGRPSLCEGRDPGHPAFYFGINSATVN